MGSFYREEYDLYKDIISDKVGTYSKLRKAIISATSEDLENELKDACILIGEHKSYDFAFGEVKILFEMLKKKLEVFEGDIIK